MMKPPQAGWDSVNKLIVSAFVGGIVFFAGLWAMNFISSNKEANVRITHNLGERFFDFLEMALKENDKPVESFEIHKAIPISQLSNIESFSGISNRLFNPNDYYFIKLGEGRYLVYCCNVPPLTVNSNEALRQMNYDSTNGTVSEGYHARLISVDD